MSSISNDREFKGASVIRLVNDYVVLDIETTGFSPVYDKIIEISAIKIRNSLSTEIFSTLVHEEDVFIDSFITNLTGITQEMVDKAPNLKDILPGLMDFIGDDIIVGQNTSFDINFLYDRFLELCDIKFTNDFIDIQRFSRKLFKENHHRLKDIAGRYGIDYSNAHRALVDCDITFKAYTCLSSDIFKLYEGFDAEKEFQKQFKDKGVRRTRTRKKTTGFHWELDASNRKYEFDSDNPIHEKYVCFTGALKRMVRKDALKLVEQAGGYPSENVTSKTNLLVLGDFEYCATVKDGKSNKRKKAEERKEKGQDIEIIPETVFYEMIDSYEIINED
jgi:DNA polymerase III subunit epsilon